jgi:hypothetical protein
VHAHREAHECAIEEDDMAGDKDDEAARKQRAEQLRKQISGLAEGKAPSHKPTPREITDLAAEEAAREQRERGSDKKGSSDC